MTRCRRHKLTKSARSFNGSGRRSDKAETKVRLLLGLSTEAAGRVGQMKAEGDRRIVQEGTCDGHAAAMETDTPDHTWGRGVTAAQQTFNLHGGGSNPSGLTDAFGPVAQR